ncbi:MAG: DMT family transporter [Flavobacteriaceae bacterium]|nr:DMT family transporter [Flavobacteriaceae bacterium]
MIYLLFSILVSSFLYVIFKLFAVFKVNTLHAIVVNYFVAFAFGFLMSESKLTLLQITSSPWFVGTFFLGILFIVIFNIMAITAQRSGVAVTSVATKMSVVIPVIFGIVVYQESAGLLKITGIILALVAVYLASVKSKEGFKWRNVIFPFLLFIGSGTIDTALKFLETNYVSPSQISIFSTTIFGFAGLFGTLFILIKRDLTIHWKSLLGGIALGIPNYFSITFLLQALATEGLESSMVFTVNNVSIVMLSTLVGLFAFKEKLLPKNWVGIGLAIISIFLVIYT